MKRLLSIISLLIYLPLAMGAEQHFDAIQVGTKAVRNSKSVADFNSTTLGFLIPRMTTTQKNAISSPPDGLLVYDTTLHDFCQYASSSWRCYLTIGTIDGTTASSNGAVISGNQLFMQSATATVPGLVNNSAQTFTGVKTFGNTNAVGGNGQINVQGTGNITVSATSGAGLSIYDPSQLLVGYTGTGYEIQSYGGTPLYINRQANDVNVANGAFNFIYSTGHLGVGQSSPSAYLHLHAGSTSASSAPLKIASGSKMTSAEAGAIENDGTDLYYTSDTPTRKTLISSSTGIASIAQGGTGQSTKSAAYNALTPITTKGDLVVGNGTNSATRLAVSTDGQVLTADSTQSTGVKWAAGGGGGTGINFVGLSATWGLSSSDDITAEASVGNWLAYADAAGTVPVDMTGGSPSSTCLRTTTSGHILDGAASFEFVKGAANRQGEGCSVLVNIPPGYRGQNAMFQAPFYVYSGTYASGDMIISVYDVTNSALLAVSNSSITGTGLLRANLVIPSTTTQVRIGFHVSSTSTSAYTVQWDDVILGPPSNIGNLALAGDWTAYTPTYDAGFGTVTNNAAFYKRVGDSVEIMATGTSGTVAASAAGVSLPSGITIDTSKISPTGNTAGTTGQAVGSYFAGSANAMGGIILAPGTSSTKVYFSQNNASGTSISSNSVSGNVMGSSSAFNWYAKLPIKEWAASGTAFTPGMVANNGAWVHDSTCRWTITNTAYADPADDGSCGFSERGNSNMGTVSSLGSKSPGISFTPNEVGTYKVCAIFGAGDNVTTDSFAFALTDASNNILQEQKGSGLAGGGSDVPFTLCARYANSTVGSTVSFKIRGKSSANTAIINNSSYAQAIEWTIEKISSQVPAPYFVGAVVNDTTSKVMNTLMAKLEINNTSSNVNSQTGSSLSYSSATATNRIVWSIASGTFSATPHCVCSAMNSGFATTAYSCSIEAESATSVTTSTWQDSTGGAAASAGFYAELFCMGPK